MDFSNLFDKLAEVTNEGEQEIKEYLGNKGDQYFYFVHSINDNGEKDYVVVDADEKVVFSAREQNILDKEPSEIVLAAIKSVDMDNVCYELLMRYELLMAKEPEPEEPEPEEPELEIPEV